jgi:glycosyltransferase involved in cell wall biosynthesis
MNDATRHAPAMSVSFIVLAYNHERFVREAVRSALAQTCEPLEIILSDDGSKDRTFEIMQEEAAAYSGPHKVLLNCNQPNLGMARHLNRTVEIASGDLVILQAGDDVSLPDRAARMIQAYRQPSPVDMVCSDAVMIDSAGAPLARQRGLPPVAPLTLEEAIARGSISALGCACAYSRTLWTKYGQIDPDVLQEDVVLPFRAMLERGIRVVSDPLVKYRIHDTNLFGGRGGPEPRDKRQRWAESWDAISRDWSASWTTSGRRDAKLERQLLQHAKQRAYDAACYRRSRLHALASAVAALFDGLTIKNVAGLIRRHVLRLA